MVEQKCFDIHPIDEIDYVANDISDIPDCVLDVVGQVPCWGADDVGSKLMWKQLISAYLATISFMDDQVGVMLDALDTSDIFNNTVVVLGRIKGITLQTGILGTSSCDLLHVS